MHDRKPDLKYLHVFGALCYPTNDSEDLRKLKPKADIVSSIPYVPPFKKDWDILFQPMFDEYFHPSPSVVSPVPLVAALIPADTTSTPSLTTIDQDASSASTSPTTEETQALVIHQEPSYEESSSRDVIPLNLHQINQPFDHLKKWTKDHTEEVYISQPEGFVDQDHPNYVYRLKKALYGLRHSLHELYDLLSKFLLSQKFSKGVVDPTLFTRKEVKDILLVQIYVDDIIFSSTNPELCNIFANIMSLKFKMSMMGKMSFFLGLQISHNPRGIFINQSKYALEMIKKYGMESSDHVDTIMVERTKLNEGLQGIPVDPTRYRSMVGSLMYLTSSRPDLVFGVCMCARIQLTTYTDADHAGCQNTRRSTSGNAQFLGDKLVSWSSKKPKSTAISTTEEQVENGVVELYFVKMEYQLADIFTKALARKQFEFLLNHLGMQSMTSETLTRLAESEEE
ncbi:retrovirus-related pol polyprotein from transposon TNT 1-94 [Tanacetum coccineum]|uniref:Retrovirus-related pol polyprotein from transposon TNT 1-94 n=1 Tax=Tanacetum coccineum TaxID=301880 RepID=A0ABQ5JDX0_9ASTR